jgi:hypothetical protein
MEVDRAMTTKVEDAASIVGEEEAKKLDNLEKESIIGKSEVLVVKADEEETPEVQEPIVEESKHMMEDEENEDMMDDEEAEGKDKKKKKEMKKSEAKAEVDKSYIGEVSVIGEPTTYKPFGGATSLKDAKAVLEAQKEKMRISDLWYALQSVIENIGEDETVEDKAKAMSVAVEEFKDMMADKSATIYNSLISLSAIKETSADHPLDESFEIFKSDYDAALKMTDLSPDDKLRLIQQSFDALGQQVIETIKTPQVTQEASPANDVVKAFSEAMQPFIQQLSLLTAEVKALKATPTTQPTTSVIPARRSIPATPQLQSVIRSGVTPGMQKSETPHLRAIIEKTT